jgi:hypothetical protein
MIHKDAVVVQDAEPVTAEVDGEIVMMSISEGAYFGLNGVGSEIWDLLHEPMSITNLCEKLAGEYDVDEETLSRTVTHFVQQMLERRLLRLVPTETGRS